MAGLNDVVGVLPGECVDAWDVLRCLFLSVPQARRFGSMINAVNATVASAAITSNDNGGVAVLKPPAAAPATTPVTPAIPVKTKRVRKPKGVAQGNIASPAARAAI